MILSEYLKQRGLTLEPTEIDVDPILESEALTKEVADLWHSKGELITKVIQARVNSIGKEMLEKASPEEVWVLRQALVEIGALVSDFNKYKGVSERQVIKNTEENKEDVEELESRPLEEGDESSL